MNISNKFASWIEQIHPTVVARRTVGMFHFTLTCNSLGHVEIFSPRDLTVIFTSLHDRAVNSGIPVDQLNCFGLSKLIFCKLNLSKLIEV